MRALVALVTILSWGQIAEAGPSVGKPTITLVSPGRAPQRAMRLTASKGMHRTMVMTMKMGMSMSMGGRTMPSQALPAIRMAIDLHVTDVSKDGDIRYEFKLKKPEVVRDSATPAAVISAMETAMAPMTGLSGHAVVTNRGFTKEADIAPLPNANAQTQQIIDSLRQSIAQFSSPVPAEKVGVGAKWKTKMAVVANGVRLEQALNNELVAFSGNRATIKITLVQTAPPQKITKNGMTIDLTSYSGSGAGETTLDLGSVVPTSATMAVHNSLQMSAGGQAIGMAMDVKMDVKGK